MGFETEEDDGYFERDEEFETSLWDLKRNSFSSSWSGVLFETSLWDLKLNKFKENREQARFETSLWDLKQYTDIRIEQESWVRNLPMGFETWKRYLRAGAVSCSKPPYGI